MISLYFATSNKHKVEEATKVCSEFGVELIHKPSPYNEIRSDSVVDIVESAIGGVYRAVGSPVIIEDTGFFIDALKGFPGTYAASVYNRIGYGGILKLMEGIDNRRAKFISAIAYKDEDNTKVFTGEVEGIIADREGGNGGFGYDPIFIPEGYRVTFAEDNDLKMRISHRTCAFKKLCIFILDMHNR